MSCYKGIQSFKLRHKVKLNKETNKTKTLKIPVTATILERKRKQASR